MYICLDCNKLFNTPRRIIEKHDLDSPPYEEWDGCPYCGGSYIDAIFCDGCEQPITGEYAQILNNAKYCENCFSLKNIED